ncbi:hypothetical protein RHGRI_036838 [Rhododendron griersonianum]|nr:hypothetical protein RHGRI_036838 [Rhododendron griersonianum]
MHLEEQEDAEGRFVNAKKNENQRTEAATGDESPATVNLSVKQTQSCSVRNCSLVFRKELLFRACNDTR